MPLVKPARAPVETSLLLELAAPSLCIQKTQLICEDSLSDCIKCEQQGNGHECLAACTDRILHVDGQLEHILSLVKG